MITQNPITGRSRNKLAGIYARTLWGQNVIQSCPRPSTVAPSSSLKASRNAFRIVTQMANMLPAYLLPLMYYTAPIGRSRRQTFASQLFAGIDRSDGIITYELTKIKEIGSNTVVCNEGILVTFTEGTKTYEIQDLNSTAAADLTIKPLILLISYEIGVILTMIDNISLIDSTLVITNIPETIFNIEFLLVPLWQYNAGTMSSPYNIFGSYKQLN